MLQIYVIIKQSQVQTNHYPWKNQSHLFNGWNQNPKKGKTLFGDWTPKVC
jgi:hypothetical protein